MNRILRVLETLVFLGVLAACLGPANAAQLQVNGGAPYLCAAVQGSNIANQTPVIAYPCSGGPNDHWQYIGGQLEGIGTSSAGAKCPGWGGKGDAPGTLGGFFPLGRPINPTGVFSRGPLYGVSTHPPI